MSYLLDSNVFIQAKNLHYGFDFCPAFWDWLDVNNEWGKVFSVEKVGDELVAGSDELAEWASRRGRNSFLLWSDGPCALWAQIARNRLDWSPQATCDTASARRFKNNRSHPLDGFVY